MRGYSSNRHTDKGNEGVNNNISNMGNNARRRVNNINGRVRGYNNSRGR